MFEKNCGVCHAYSAEGFPATHNSKVKYRASDLGGFATEKWIRGLLEKPDDPKYFGLTKLEGMKNWRAKVDKAREKWKKNDGPEEAAEKIKSEEADWDIIARWVADQARPKAKRDAALETKGKDLFQDTCATCHTIQGEGGKTAPDLTDYGSGKWVRGMIMDPASPARYGKNNEMTAFRNETGPAAAQLLAEFMDLHQKNDTKINVTALSDIDRELIIRWLLHDDRVVFGGQSIASPPSVD